MSNNDAQSLENAEEIIERFGGIRPMASKIDAPVTTVQGWKKRNVIPAGRREQILSAASDNDIDLSDLVGGKTASTANENKQDHKAKAEEKKPAEKPVLKVEPSKTKETVKDVVKEEPTKLLAEKTLAARQAHEASEPERRDMMAAIEASSRRTIVQTIWIVTGLILLTAAVGAFLLWPSAKKIDEQSEKLSSLQSEVETVAKKTSLIDKYVPEDIQAKMDDLQMQARNIQTTVSQLSDRAEAISDGVVGFNAGPLSDRLAVLEQQMSLMSGPENNFGALVGRIKKLEETIPGQEQLGQSIAELRGIVENMDSQQALDQNLADAQDADSALGQTLEGVDGNDLKAAAMLIAFSQLRDSLEREAPFENDLALLQKLVGNENPELQASLQRLAPHANGGVLTSEGLSKEFKGLAGDIVVSSLKGEDVSLKDKAKARLSGIFQVEKDGALVNGTPTQQAVTKAQTQLDAGDIQGALNTLKALDGEAAATAQPFVQQAEVSLLAEKAQQILSQTILSKVSGQLPPQTGGVPLNMDDVKRNLEGAIPMIGNDVVHDENSGITVLPNQSGFKGFSAGK